MEMITGPLILFCEICLFLFACTWINLKSLKRDFEYLEEKHKNLKEEHKKLDDKVFNMRLDQYKYKCRCKE